MLDKVREQKLVVVCYKRIAWHAMSSKIREWQLSGLIQGYMRERSEHLHFGTHLRSSKGDLGTSIDVAVVRSRHEPLHDCEHQSTTAYFPSQLHHHVPQHHLRRSLCTDTPLLLAVSDSLPASNPLITTSLVNCVSRPAQLRLSMQAVSVDEIGICASLRLPKDCRLTLHVGAQNTSTIGTLAGLRSACQRRARGARGSKCIDRSHPVLECMRCVTQHRLSRGLS
ncbi:hypothetical protein IQ07DRAFT_128734 [Pyrenochaeta sp. DS3sAY3a]|nr:hypothetical protein IQ07DRAFT_128734 [Pyrenochaeta sp. DS3sAY3a]